MAFMFFESTMNERPWPQRMRYDLKQKTKKQIRNPQFILIYRLPKAFQKFSMNF